MKELYINLIIGIVGILIIILAGVFFYYKYKRRLDAFYRLYNKSENKIQKYIDSYELLYSKKIPPQINTLEDFNNNVPLIGYNIDNQWDSTEDLYRVLHDLCIIGGLNKMYVPPHLDNTTDINLNQLLTEKKLSDYLNVKPNGHLLELGCGCGAISQQIASNTKCIVTGINIDKETLEKGKQYLKQEKNDSVILKYADLNNPLEFEDNSLDGVYEIQAMTFSKDLGKLFKEIYRVLKPGKRLVILDGVPLDNFDKNNPKNMEKYWDVRGITAGGGVWHPKYWEKKGKEAGFNIMVSTCGDKYDTHYANELPVLIDISNYYCRIRDIIEILASWKILPSHLSKLFNRLCQGSESLLELCKENKMTTNYFFVFEKPDKETST